MGESVLHQRSCEACEGKTSRLSSDDQARLSRQLPEWKIVDNHHLYRKLKTKEFIDGVELVNRIAQIAEGESHHPDIFIAWGTVEVVIFTHKVNGLTENDFILAAKIDQVCAA